MLCNNTVAPPESGATKTSSPSTNMIKKHVDWLGGGCEKPGEEEARHGEPS
jgi:hypothetical protein